MTFKKIQAIIIAVTISAVTISGCGSSKESTESPSTIDSSDTTGADTADSDDISNDMADSGETSDDVADSGKVTEDSVDSIDAADDISSSEYMAADGETASKSMSKETKKDSAEDTPDTEPSDPVEAKAGVLTAGRWNDNDNWGFFTNLVNNETITFPSYGIDPRNRFTVTVKNSDGKPLPNKSVTMKSEDGSAIWQSVTDKDGTAYLFYQTSDKAASVEITKDDGNIDSYKIKPANKTFGAKDKDSKDKTGNQNNTGASDSSLEITIGDSPVNYSKMDIMYIMDATGSMTDEMTFLQKDFSKIAKEIHNDNIRYSVNFYRDEGDEYVTKCFDFTKDIEALQKNLNDQTADGGGDIPEAVHTILDESINKSSWRKDSVKLAFLIYDAPPHNDDKVSKSLISSIKKASELGIRVIPVVSSNAERETELFGRAIAICSNGEYVFLTDDSGVGESHLEPIIGDYKVQPLYDIIIDIINEYTQK